MLSRLVGSTGTIAHEKTKQRSLSGIARSFLLAVAAICSHTGRSSAQDSQSYANIQERVSTSCKAGPLHLHEALYASAPQDGLVIDAIISEDNKVNILRTELCNRYDQEYIDDKYKQIIALRLDVLNSCADAAMNAARNRNWQAEFALTKEQETIASDIVDIVTFSEFIGRASAGVSSAAETTYNGVSNTIGIIDGVKETQVLASLGGKALRNFVAETSDERTFDQAKDFAIDRANPWDAVGDITKSIADIRFRKRLDEIMSFAHSRCQ